MPSTPDEPIAKGRLSLLYALELVGPFMHNKPRRIFSLVEKVPVLDEAVLNLTVRRNAMQIVSSACTGIFVVEWMVLCCHQN